VRHITSSPARRIGALDRGLIRPGFMADLVLFDPDTLRDSATYEVPRSYPEGIHFVVNNGVVIFDEGQPTGETPGIALRSPFGRQPVRVEAN
jgi:N-acyl-D-amino-acid deacylase